MIPKRTAAPGTRLRGIMLRRSASRIGSRTVAYLASFLFVTTLCSILYLNQASHVDALRQEIRAKQAQCAELRRRNALRREGVARLGCLATMDQWAKKLGLVELGPPLYIPFDYVPPTAVAVSADGEEVMEPTRRTDTQSERGVDAVTVSEGAQEPGGLRRWIRRLMWQFEAWLNKGSAGGTGTMRSSWSGS